MVDFIKSFKEGLESVERIDKERVEIESVFMDLERQISEATNSVINIFISEEASLAPTPDSFFITHKPSPYKLIKAEAYVGDTVVFREIARWSTHPEGGYPCKVKYDNVENGAFDKESLELILGDLLMTPRVGRIFKELLGTPTSH